jgi:hypothetical protein
MSRPSRARGLKLLVGLDVTHGFLVAPLAGAWIENQKPLRWLF